MGKRKKKFVESNSQLLALCDDVIKTHDTSLEERLQSEIKATEDYKQLMEHKRASKSKSKSRRKKLLEQARTEVLQKDSHKKKKKRAQLKIKS